MKNIKTVLSNCVEINTKDIPARKTVVKYYDVLSGIKPSYIGTAVLEHCALSSTGQVIFMAEDTDSKLKRELMPFNNDLKNKNYFVTELCVEHWDLKRWEKLNKYY